MFLSVGNCVQEVSNLRAKIRTQALWPQRLNTKPRYWSLPSSLPHSQAYRYLMKSVSSESLAPKPAVVARGQSCSVQGQKPILGQKYGAKRIREWFSGKPGLWVTFCPRGAAKSDKAESRVYSQAQVVREEALQPGFQNLISFRGICLSC